MSKAQRLTKTAVRDGPWCWLLRKVSTFTASILAALPQQVGGVQTGNSFDHQDRILLAGISTAAVPTTSLIGAGCATSDLPIAYLVLGSPADRKAFSVTIRAFALAGRLGDRLTLVGYGCHRHRLERWSIALGIDAMVSFAGAEQEYTVDYSLFDVAIILPQRQHDREHRANLDLLPDGKMVIAQTGTKLMHDERPKTVDIPCGIRTMIDAILAVQQSSALASRRGDPTAA